MLSFIGASHFDLEKADFSATGNLMPGVPSNGNRIDAIGNDRLAQSEIVFRQCVGDAVPRIIHLAGDRPRISKRLLDRIDSQIHGVDFAGKLASNRGFSDSRQATEDDQRG